MGRANDLLCFAFLLGLFDHGPQAHRRFFELTQGLFVQAFFFPHARQESCLIPLPGLERRFLGLNCSLASKDRFLLFGDPGLPDRQRVQGITVLPREHAVPFGNDGEILIAWPVVRPSSEHAVGSRFAHLVKRPDPPGVRTLQADEIAADPGIALFDVLSDPLFRAAVSLLISAWPPEYPGYPVELGEDRTRFVRPLDLFFIPISRRCAELFCCPPPHRAAYPPITAGPAKAKL
jgi:hypothetical protein